MDISGTPSDNKPLEMLPGAVEREFGVDWGEKSDGGFFSDGYMRVYGKSADRAYIGYYVKGGATGEGYMTISFYNDVQNPEGLAHFMGCLDPSDVRYAGLSNTYNLGVGDTYAFDVPSLQRILIVSMVGIQFRITYHFSQGMCDVVLVYTAKGSGGSETKVLDGETGEETEESVDSVEFQDAVKITVHYRVVPSGS